MEEKKKRKLNNQTKNCTPDLVLKGQARGELSIFLHQSSSVGWPRSCSAGQAESTAETLSCGQGLSVLPLLTGWQITEKSHWSGVNWKTRVCTVLRCSVSYFSSFSQTFVQMYPCGICRWDQGGLAEDQLCSLLVGASAGV